MLLESIGYTAMLIDYIAQQTQLSIKEIAVTIGEDGLARLAHNAPMNRHLPISQIAGEVMADNYISRLSSLTDTTPNKAFGIDLMQEVERRATGKQQYAHVLYEALISDTL